MAQWLRVSNIFRQICKSTSGWRGFESRWFYQSGFEFAKTSLTTSVAVDSVLFSSHKNVDVINDQLNRHFNSLCDWLVDNKLSIHFGEDKTKCILFTSKNKIKKWATCLLIMETSKLSNIPR